MLATCGDCRGYVSISRASLRGWLHRVFEVFRADASVSGDESGSDRTFDDGNARVCYNVNPNGTVVFQLMLPRTPLRDKVVFPSAPWRTTDPDAIGDALARAYNAARETELVAT